MEHEKEMGKYFLVWTSTANIGGFYKKAFNEDIKRLYKNLYKKVIKIFFLSNFVFLYQIF